jgi:hypothetical protein
MLRPACEELCRVEAFPESLSNGNLGFIDIQETKKTPAFPESRRPNYMIQYGPISPEEISDGIDFFLGRRL